MTEQSRYDGIRSIFEAPLLDARKWERIPNIAADAIFVDLEDSVPHDRKEEGRAKAVEVLADRDYFGGRVVIARPNPLETPWGHDDIKALAASGVGCVALPKIRAADDLRDVQKLFQESGSNPDMIPIIETAQATLELGPIAAHESVIGLLFGASDLSSDVGIPLFEADGQINTALIAVRNQVAFAGAAYGRLTIDLAMSQNIRDLDDIRLRYEESRRVGFTVGVTFYPPHVAIINEVFTPSDEDIRQAESLVQEYESTLRAGSAAVTQSGGRVLLIHDYKKALKVLDRAAAVGLETPL